jgi:hypothetical protein
MVAGFHEVPTVWQVPQVFCVIGAVLCADAPVAGRPVAVLPLWQVVQLVPVVVTFW